MDEEVVPILRVEDAAAAVAWYERLGFTKQCEHRFEKGLPAFVEVARGGVRLFLSEHKGDARPDTSVYLRVRDAEAIASEFGVQAKDALQITDDLGPQETAQLRALLDRVAETVREDRPRGPLD
ncbi:glyoxalase superfamily protein [Streptomyces massasporeus]|uniref:glyoxalase superfamily protein n=1 Tax=Streptomyces massasporeus TaxID=67324 RepID=UPI00368D0EAB